MTVVHNNRMWFMGGWYNGRLPGHEASNEVWSSTNGRTWRKSPAPAGWSPRLAAAAVTFQGEMWILGGIERYHDGTEKSLKNDVWASKDGRSWRQVTSAAAWSPRAYHQAAVFNGRMYVMGGGNYVPGYFATNDVWSSADGVQWRRETGAAPWSPRMWFSSVVYRNRMWVIGGWSNNPDKNWNDVWSSNDGKTWEQLPSDVVWTERHEHSAFVFQDKMWVAGGNARPLDSQVWTLDLPKDW